MSSKSKISLYYLINLVVFTFFYYLIYIDKMNVLFISLFVYLGLLIAIQSYTKEIIVKAEPGFKQYIPGLFIMFFFFIYYKGDREIIYLLISYVIFLISHIFDYRKQINLIEE